MNSTAFVRFIVGPVGSGKTTGLIFTLLMHAAQQAPGPDGYRRTRWAIVRQTLLQLKMTLLLDLLSWLRPIADYKVSEQLVVLEFNDVRAELYLIPLDDEEDQKRLLSMQLTGCVINELIEIEPGLIDAIAGRCGRFPSALQGGCTWAGIIGDTNAPTEGSDWWRLFEEDKPPDWQIFWQPGGMEPGAENLEWLMQTPATLKLPLDHPERRNQGRTYYERLCRGKNQIWIDRYVHAKYGEDPSGAAVWRGSFRRAFHVKRGLQPIVGYPLLIGQDLGRNPCSLIGQPDYLGRLVIFEEVVSLDLGLELHVTKFLKPRIYAERYAGHRFAAVIDPSGIAKGNFLEENSVDVLSRLGIPAFPASTNNIDPRIIAVETLLLQQRDGGPALLIDEEKCPILVAAMAGLYRYSKTQQGVVKALPDKTHPYSDVADCLQYMALALNSGLTTLIAKKIKPKPARRPPPRVSAAGWT